MSETLPFFKYHPNPIETGNIKASEDICLCCHQRRGFIYQATIHTELDLEGSVCPWCIADGRAAEKFDASFTESGFPQELSPEIVEELSKRTPGYLCWQVDVWEFHCQDACEFHGDAAETEVKSFDRETFLRFCDENFLTEETGREIIEYYKCPGNPAIYKFVCRHCQHISFYMDMT
jgi:uncharacterized protein